MQINLTEQELLSVIAVVGNTGSTGSILYEAYLKLQECGIDEFGEMFQEKIKEIEEEIFNNASPFYAKGLEELIEKVATKEVK